MKISNRNLPNNSLSSVESRSQAVEAKLKNVATMYEKQFLSEMMKAMRSTVQEGGFIQTSNAEKIFRDQLDSEYVDKWGDSGGIGLSELIYQQMVEKYGDQLGIRKGPLKPIGPIQMNKQNEFHIKVKANGEVNDSKNESNTSKKSVELTSFEIIKNKPQSNNDKTVEPILNMWDGKVKKHNIVDLNQNVLEIEHDNGLTSQIIFSGTKQPLGIGEEIKAGQTIGMLSPESNAFYLNVYSNSI